MKKVLMLCLALVMGAGMTVDAATKGAPKKMVTTVFSADVDCEHCVKKIMDNVPSLGKGIKDVQVSLEKKEITVVYDGSKNSDEKIVEGLASLKVDAQVKKTDAGTVSGK
ncbi:heavy-metal-associated domain-containing protein [uncultured Alistipes sp.]|uniref:heavy-metal-associated domain-containing protein n=1 Tax=uncultured Alistipes sp. TaxID=538949 RepID=UPI0028042BB5|nr:heavy-metal-associated domain-containing protein [uncultured Alistipes sp.]